MEDLILPRPPGATKLPLLTCRIWSFLGHPGLQNSYFSHGGFDPSLATRGYKAPTSHMEDLILPRPPGATKLLLLTCRIWSFLGHPGLQSSYFSHGGFDPSSTTRGYKALTSHMEDLILPRPPGATKLLLLTWRIWSFLGHMGLQSSYLSHVGFDPSSATRGYKAPTSHMEDLILPRPPGATKLLLLTCRIWSFLGHMGLQSSYLSHGGFDPSLATRGYKAPTSHMEDLILPRPPGATKLLLLTWRIWSFLGHMGLQSSYLSHVGFDPSSATWGYKAPTSHMEFWSFLGHPGLQSSYFSHGGLILPWPPGATKLLLLIQRFLSFLGHPGSYFTYKYSLPETTFYWDPVSGHQIISILSHAPHSCCNV